MKKHNASWTSSLKYSNCRRLLITCVIPVLMIPVPPLAIVFLLLSLHTYYPKMCRRLSRLLSTGFEHDYRFIRSSMFKAEALFEEFYSSKSQRMQIMLIALSATLAVFYLVRLARQGPDVGFLDYLMTYMLFATWLFFSIFAYGSKLGIVAVFNNGKTRRIVLSALIVASLALGRFLLIEFAGSVFPVNASALMQTFYVGVFMKTLVLLGFAVTIFAGVFQLCLLVILLSDSSGRKNWLRGCLVICQASVVFSSYILGAALQELSRGNTGNLALIYVAESLDFTKTHLCSAAPEERVLFLDGVPDRALAARFPSLPVGPLPHMESKKIKEAMPTGFRMVPCNPLEPTLTSK